jgi:hypothetical protein
MMRRENIPRQGRGRMLPGGAYMGRTSAVIDRIRPQLANFLTDSIAVEQVDSFPYGGAGEAWRRVCARPRGQLAGAREVRDQMTAGKPPGPGHENDLRLLHIRRSYWAW